MMTQNFNSTKIYIGMGTCGLAAGAERVYDKTVIELKRLGLAAEIVRTGCIGMCHREVLFDIKQEGRSRVCYSNVSEDDIVKILTSQLVDGKVFSKKAFGQIKISDDDEVFPDLPLFDALDFNKTQQKIILHRCGHIDPERIDDHTKRGGYDALSRILSRPLDPTIVIDIIKRSGLRGRGGGGFPTGMKWEFCRAAYGDEKYIICNADEGDPGAFMDRSLLEGDPHAVLEGMIIAGYAIGAGSGTIYIRAEYPLAIKRLKIAIAQAYERDFLGKNILGGEFSFDIEIVEGAGAFVCGEETALIASIEGRRGNPRSRPPFPAQKGLWGKPTNINNVETYANVPAIITNGADWYNKIGTKNSKGTKIFALTGKINKTGLIEVPMGITLREVIFDIGGGIQNKKRFKAVQIGGPSGGCLPEGLLDSPIDYDSLLSAGAMMGSGGMVVMDERNCMVNIARFFLNFTQHESCGKCNTCRIGLRTMFDILANISIGEGREGDIELLEELGRIIQDASLCGLGRTAPNPVLSTIRYFRDEYETHIFDKKCPAKVCVALLNFEVDKEKCEMCGLCFKKCTTGAITWHKDEPAHIDKDKCVMCRTCIEVCSSDAIN